MTFASSQSLEATVVFSMIGAIALHALLAVGLYLWGRWVARRHQGSWWRRAAWLPIVGLGLSVVGATLTTVFLVRAFNGLAGVDPSQRARLVAEGISNAINTTAVCVIPAWLIYLASLIVFGIGTALRPRKNAPRDS